MVLVYKAVCLQNIGRLMCASFFINKSGNLAVLNQCVGWVVLFFERVTYDPHAPFGSARALPAGYRYNQSIPQIE